ncbi:PREDICTED: syntaxin-5-like [Amphimedon queenslandica]|uniref:t-SNARE coiled-coil homology domain-containing protein n=1 Tax=Amphimedon queenslandica TaxID=400682 RepID=A0A1X7UAQ2_AMPQE|nr:PREDICTED: syntaxin-5-like [Amphimedon queenslandica]|eukprot:XP_011405691.1 PREDICTED: syntaxin-5-like [Amphimedon queenslandica]
MSTGRDRTLEFANIVKSFQPINGVHKRLSSPPTHGKRSAFHAAAKEIGRELNRTVAKLEKLTELARGRSLFGDPALEIQDLTQSIKQDLSKLNSDIAALQQLSQTVNSRESKHVKSHSSAVVVSLQTRLADTSQNFKSVLEMRTENLKVQKQRREQFSSPLTSSLNNDSPLNPAMTNGSLLLGTDDRGRGEDVSIDMGSATQMQLLQEQDTYIQERADAMANIHSTIVELGQIFRQLATMVKEQEEQVVRIDTNVSEAEINIEAGYGELLKYFRGVTSNRWLMVKIFAVIIVFFIIFVVFLT